MNYCSHLNLQTVCAKSRLPAASWLDRVSAIHTEYIGVSAVCHSLDALGITDFKHLTV